MKKPQKIKKEHDLKELSQKPLVNFDLESLFDEANRKKTLDVLQKVDDYSFVRDIEFRRIFAKNKLINSRFFKMNLVVQIANEKHPVTIQAGKHKVTLKSSDFLELLEVKDFIKFEEDKIRSIKIKELAHYILEHLKSKRKVQSKTIITLDEAKFIYDFLYKPGLLDSADSEQESNKKKHSIISRLLK